MVVTGHHEYLCAEAKRLKEDRERKRYWKRYEAQNSDLNLNTEGHYQMGPIHS